MTNLSQTIIGTVDIPGIGICPYIITETKKKYYILSREKHSLNLKTWCEETKIELCKKGITSNDIIVLYGMVDTTDYGTSAIIYESVNKTNE